MSEDNNKIKEFIANLPYSYRVTNSAKEIKDNYSAMEGKKVSVAGRVFAVRKAGKLVFIDILDSTEKIQAYFDFAVLGEEKLNEAKSFNPGDIIGVEGTIFKTKPGEISIKVSSSQQLAKALRPLPDKWHGIQSTELRYRKRYLDLIMNPDARRIFKTRSLIVRHIRNFLDSKGFLEVETPAIQPLYGGATAEPFKVHVNTLGEEHYLRISDELYLKRLIIGGFDKVYEIGKDFRNEDFDSSHSPEFTMIEWYQAYADYNDVMELAEQLLTYIVKQIFGTDEIAYQGKKVKFKPPFKRIKFVDAIGQKIGKDVLELSDKELLEIAQKHGVEIEASKRHRAHIYDKMLKTLIQPELIEPTFVIDYPAGTTTLCRPKRGNPELIERFELFMGGVKLSNAYSELNNPIIQKENFDAELEKKKMGDKEIEPTDTEFVEAMEHGMPPTGGYGMGIEKLTMILTDSPSIKEVILFPMEKRE